MYMRRKIALYERLKDEIDDRVGLIFDIYCKALDIHRAYGVESWDIGNKLVIKQDTSCRGCYDYTNHRLPVEWIDIEYREELENTINAWASDLKEKEDRVRREELKNQAIALRERARRIEENLK